MTKGSQPLIGRIWRGRVKGERLSEYLEYNRTEGLDEIARQPGCVGVQQLSAVESDVAEVTTISYWESLEAMHAFHGEGLSVSHLDRDPEFLLEMPDRVALVDVHVNSWI
jgi:heme-degrading monooxygenase HmoA